MNKIVYAILCILAFASCANSYNIEGTSDLSVLDGQKLYLNVEEKDTARSIDSCDVVHGAFAFSGSIDTVRLANIVVDENVALPLILEGGDINVKVNNAEQTVTGTPLNDKLTKFMRSCQQLLAQRDDLVHQQNQAYLNGQDINLVNQRLAKEDDIIVGKIDKLFSSYVTQNFDNILGSAIFRIYVEDVLDGNAVLTPWVEDMMSRATDKFKADPFVSAFYEQAKKNQSIMNGTADAPVEPSQDVAGSNAPAPPTPNEMAADSVK